MTEQEARELGRKVYRDGGSRAPVLCSEYMQAIEGMKIGEGAAGLARAFLAGWDTENINDAVEGLT